MGKDTRIYNRFEWWSIADCACVYCINYAGEDRLCPLDACCCEDIRLEAVRRRDALLREYDEDGRAQIGQAAVSCLA